MDERGRKALMKSFQRSSVTGMAIITFALAFAVLHYAKVDIVYSAILSSLFSASIVLARTRSTS